MPTWVRVSQHAVTRLRSRFPAEYGSLEIGALHLQAADEVVAAIGAHRMATRIPKWAVKPGTTSRSRGRRGRGELNRALRYVWTEDEARVYLIDRGRHAITVLTVLAASAPEDADTGADVDAA